jgi:hypothetical protein
VLVPLVAAALVACGGGDSEQESTGTEAESTVADAESAPADDGSGVQPDPVAVEACLEAAGLTVRNQDEVDVPYTDEQLDFFELETELLVEGGDTELISGSINFYRTLEKAEAQEVVFEESVPTTPSGAPERSCTPSSAVPRVGNSTRWWRPSTAALRRTEDPTGDARR